MGGRKAPRATRSRCSSTACGASSRAAASTSAPCAEWATSSSGRMRREPPQLRKQLLAWLLVPLFVLLLLDSFVSYRVALEFARRAYDRSLVEVARDLSLHLRRESGAVTLDLPAEARRILLEDPDDRISHEVLASDGSR